MPAATSLALLLASCGVLVALHLMRASSQVKLKTMLVAGVLSMILVIVVTRSWRPVIATYPKAESHRLVVGAAQRLEQALPQSDSVVVLEGSSVFAHGLPPEPLERELQKLGHRACVLSLSQPGADHFERECMGEDLWAQLSANARQRMSTMPVLWVKELHWTYESQPARFVARDLETQRVMAHCDFARSLRMAAALHSNWKTHTTHLRLDGPEAWKLLPFAEFGGVVRLGLFNLFHGGRLQRLLDEPPNPDYSPLRPQDLDPVLDAGKSFWANRLPVTELPQLSRDFRARRWFDHFLSQSHAPINEAGVSLVLFQPPSYSRTERRYTAAWQHNPRSQRIPVILANTDSQLLQRLDDIRYWRDSLHMEQSGAEALAPWVAERLLSYFTRPKP